MNEIRTEVKLIEYESTQESSHIYFDRDCSWFSDESDNLVIVVGNFLELKSEKDYDIIATFAKGEWRYIRRVRVNE